MLITNKALIYFAVALKLTWVLMILLYHPLFLFSCLLIAIVGLIYFFKKNAFMFIKVALIGWFFDCIWHILGIIDFSNSPIIPFWLLPLWLTYSVFIVYFFEKFKKYVYIIPLVFGCLNLISYAIGIKLGGAAVNIDVYYIATMLSWAMMAIFIFQFKLYIKPLEFRAEEHRLTR